MSAPSAAPSRERPPELRRVLGLLPVTVSGVGIIIGAGIYVLLGAATAEAGATVWLAFLLAGLVSALTALSYAELSAMFPTAGGEYAYARHALPPPLPFLVGWLMATGLVLAAAALVFFAFIGFDEVTTLAEETRDPTTTIPRALLLALGLSTALYVGVALAAVSVLGPAALAASPRPLADVFAHVFGWPPTARCRPDSPTSRPAAALRTRPSSFAAAAPLPSPRSAH